MRLFFKQAIIATNENCYIIYLHFEWVLKPCINVRMSYLECGMNSWNFIFVPQMNIFLSLVGLFIFIWLLRTFRLHGNLCEGRDELPKAESYNRFMRLFFKESINDQRKFLYCFSRFEGDSKSGITSFFLPQMNIFLRL